MDERKSDLVAKVPQVTLLFWIIKILATTLGETGGDAVTMSWLGETTAGAKGTGYLIGTAIFGVVFVAAVLVQIRAKKFHPFLYWLTIVATTTVGTTLADYCESWPSLVWHLLRPNHEPPRHQTHHKGYIRTVRPQGFHFRGISLSNRRIPSSYSVRKARTQSLLAR
jgi:uncharacterized membrane protein YbhN (UPF0104 family)